ncbi:MAG: ATP-dependent Clp protease adapter ClpS [Pseudomonadota bacterium]
MAGGKPGRFDDDPDREGGAGVVEETDKKLKKPQLYRVLLHNDDYTTMEFVVMVLMTVFHHQQTEAMRIMLQVHHNGTGVAGVYSHEVAETKASKVMEMARHNEYPLQCSVEPA